MITDNFKNKIFKSMKDNILCFSYTVDGSYKEKEPYEVIVQGKTIKVSLVLDNTDIGKVTDIKVLDMDRQVLFKTNAIYYKNSETGVYISFSISDILEVN